MENTTKIQPAFLNATGELPFRLTNDYLFRAVLQENAEVLKHLISALLNIPYTYIRSCEITNPIILGDSFDEKTIIMEFGFYSTITPSSI